MIFNGLKLDLPFLLDSSVQVSFKTIEKLFQLIQLTFSKS